MKEKGSLYITCGPMLEPLLTKELNEIGIEGLREGYRGVYVDKWDMSTIYRINYASRIATRVLLPLSKFKCRNQEELYNGILNIDWLQIMSNAKTLAIDCNIHQHPEIRNSLFAAQLAKDAICDQLREATGLRPSVDLHHPDVQLNLYIQQGMAVMSLDTSGAPLHRRGYRMEGGEAPLQETLAAALLYLAEYNKDKILLDPCCGSGTLLVEAALIATKTPPGYLRKRWGFQNHPEFNQIEWLRVRNELDAKRLPMPPKHLFGVDLNKNAVRIARTNLRAAGFHPFADVALADFREFTPTVTPDFLISNPPHGVRLEDESILKPLYRALGDFMKHKCIKPSKGFIFTTSLELAKEVGLAATKRHVLSSGGLDARLLEFDIY